LKTIERVIYHLTVIFLRFRLLVFLQSVRYYFDLRVRLTGESV